MLLSDKRIGIKEKRISFIENNVDTKHFYPYKSAVITVDKNVVGILGYIHPTTLKSYNIPDVIYAELLLDKVFDIKKEKTSYKAVDKFPSSNRDLAIVVKDDVKASDMLAAVKKWQLLHLLRLLKKLVVN